ncbi:MAG: NADH-quinone oxidoreductase subunit C [bacterium]
MTDESPGVQEILSFIGDNIPEENRFEPSQYRGEIRVIIQPEDLVEICRELKNTEPFYFLHLSDITAVHYPDREQEYEVVYQLYSFKLNQRLRLKLQVREEESVPSLTDLWSTANWLERECYDMFGIQFDGHPKLERILMPKATQSHPLRKSYPLQPREDFQQRRPEVAQEAEEWDIEYGPHPR